MGEMMEDLACFQPNSKFESPRGATQPQKLHEDLYLTQRVPNHIIPKHLVVPNATKEAQARPPPI